MSFVNNLFNWRSIISIFVIWLLTSAHQLHPLYISVLEIEHNQKEQQFEISCRIFTNDFETTLRKYHQEKIDLLSPSQHDRMGVLINSYLQKHIRMEANGQSLVLNYLGYQQAEECVEIFYEVPHINAVKQLKLYDDILYDFHTQQMSLIHVTVNGQRKSTRLNNPESLASFSFN